MRGCPWAASAARVSAGRASRRVKRIGSPDFAAHAAAGIA